MDVNISNQFDQGGQRCDQGKCGKENISTEDQMTGESMDVSNGEWSRDESEGRQENLPEEIARTSMRCKTSAD